MTFISTDECESIGIDIENIIIFFKEYYYSFYDVLNVFINIDFK
jgi:hypothetical protein